MMVIDPETERKRTIRTRNRAVMAILLALAALFYVVALVRVGGLG
ncbi:MAG: hypothetical protein ACREE3_16115 [Stellaceae bacterium]